MKAIPYYRVSSTRQEKSGLGLDAQATSVLNYVQNNGLSILHEFTEIESGKNNSRPILKQAIDKAKQTNAILVIAKLDRLSRSVSFISQLMEKKVKFVCCDMPEANELTIHIFAAVAQWERQRISERIKEALAAKKEREPNWTPGTNNLTDDARAKASKTISCKARESKSIRHAWHLIRSLRLEGQSYGKIAYNLSMEGYKTPKGNSNWHANQVRNIYIRFNHNLIS
jgi:DNA invertase Pin-like site-specific DNA recombinase